MDANEALLRPVNGGFHGTSKEFQGLERMTLKGSWCKKQSRWSIDGCNQENENCRSTESQKVFSSAEKTTNVVDDVLGTTLHPQMQSIV